MSCAAFHSLQIGRIAGKIPFLPPVLGGAGVTRGERRTVMADEAMEAMEAQEAQAAKDDDVEAHALEEVAEAAEVAEAQEAQ